MQTCALIPARAGSKGVKNKNIRHLCGKPLIAYAIEAALQSKEIDRVIVTTDSPEIAVLAKSLGAEVPFLRPSVLAQDKSLDRSYIEHALEWLLLNEGITPELIAILRPTTPLRDSFILDLAVKKMKEDFNEVSSLRSVHPLAEPPQKMLQIQNNFLVGFFPEDTRKEYYNLPRQAFPTAYQPNGYIDIVKSSFIKEEVEGIFGSKMIGFETLYSVEIDTEEEFEYLEFLMEKKHA